MARYFLDSSALVKRYHQEATSPSVENMFQGTGDRFFVSRLALVEIHSVAARLVREHVFANADFDTLTARLNEDIATRVLHIVALSSRRLDGASSVLSTVGLTNTVRTLDAIHLATAHALHSSSKLAAFVAADKRLLIAAAACGLPILDVG